MPTRVAASFMQLGRQHSFDLVQGGELPTKAHVLGAARTAGLQLMVSEHTAPDATDMSKHFAATLRVWRLKLVHVWHACWKSGARDSQLRQYASIAVASSSSIIQVPNQWLAQSSVRSYYVVKAMIMSK